MNSPIVIRVRRRPDGTWRARLRGAWWWCHEAGGTPTAALRKLADLLDRETLPPPDAAPPAGETVLDGGV